ncbi:MAG: HlyD family efflux transporter periplasmic adaptor subunit [Ferrovum sp.]|nr:HlyD family efflux transporter periplasmic adaptor subunit [Ferrovum sp.]NDU87643.1 HlyD family efflux transporter periplasmic adaptor subunit [Ferrovum sp.]
MISAIVIVFGLWEWNIHRHSTQQSSSLRLYGDVDIREAQPAFNASGAITEIKVWEGSHVTKGDLLARLDDSRYLATLTQAKKLADSLKANLAKLVAGSRPEEIAQAKATMESLRAIADKNQLLYQRTQELVPQGAASTEDQDNALAQLNSSRASFEAAQQNYILAVKGPRAEDIAAARSAVDAAEAATALAQRQFDDTRLYAPADGVVEERILEPGDMAAPSTPVLTLALTDPLWVRAYIPENHLGQIHLGMEATLSSDSYPGHIYQGWIGYLSPMAEFTPKSVESPELRTALVYQARVYVCDAHGELRLGMPVTVDIALQQTATHPPSGCLPHANAP